MRLRSLLLESEAAEQAKQLGLERKPGFGNYGPKGQDVITHQSRDGKLVAVQAQQVKEKPAKKTSSGGAKTPTKTPKTSAAPKPKKSTPSPSPKPPVPQKKRQEAEVRRARADTKGGPRKLGNILDVVKPPKIVEEAPTVFETAWSPKEVTVATGELFGVDLSQTFMYDDNKIKVGEDFREKEESALAGEQDRVYGAFNSVSRAIWLHPKLRTHYAASLKTEPEKWTPWMYQAHTTIVHEAIHASSPRLREKHNVRMAASTGGEVSIGPLLMLPEDTLGLEEGLTEFLARQISEKVYEDKGVPPDVIKDKNFSSYKHYVEGIRLMSLYGGLDPLDVFHNTDSMEELREVGQKAQDKMLSDLLQRELGVTEEEFTEFLDELHYMERRDEPSYDVIPTSHGDVYIPRPKLLSILDGYFQATLMRYVELARNGNQEELPTSITDSLLDALE